MFTLWKRKGSLFRHGHGSEEKESKDVLNLHLREFSLFSYLSTQTSNHHVSEKFSCKHCTPGAEKVRGNSQSETYTETTTKKKGKCKA